MKIYILLLLITSFFSCTNEINKKAESKEDTIEIIEKNVPYKEILISIMGTLSAFLIWRLQHQKDKIKDIENQLSEKKHLLYSELVYIIIDLATASKIGKELTEEDILKRLMTIKRDLFLYAPDNVFKTFTEWTLHLNKPNSGINHFKIYFKMMNLARKDMGKSSSKISLDDFMLFLMQDENEYKKFKEANNW